MNNTSDELDLGALFERINAFFRSIVVAIFNAIHFILRNWLIIVVLIILGVVLGYFAMRNYQPSQSANVVVRTNFNSAEYTYNALELLYQKSKEKDTVFLRQNGFRADTIEIKKLEILPVVSFKDIAENYDPSDRNLDALLRYVEFEEAEEKINSFNADYKYHTIEFKLSASATDKTIDNVMEFLNNRTLIKELARVGKKSIEEQIERNNTTFDQIDSTLANYNRGQPLPSPASQIFVVDKNFNISNMLEIKMELQKENRQLKEELVYAENAIVKLSDETIFVEEEGILGNKIILYPFLLVFFFLFLAWMRHVYRYFERVAAESK